LKLSWTIAVVMLELSYWRCILTNYLTSLLFGVSQFVAERLLCLDTTGRSFCKVNRAFMKDFGFDWARFYC